MPRPNSYIYESDSIKLVEVLIQYCRIGEIDTINEKYQAEICIESKWIEREPISAYDPRKHWNPMLQIENALQIGSEQVDYHVVRDRDSDFNIITEIRYVKGFSKLYLHRFFHLFSFDLISVRLFLGTTRVASFSHRSSRTEHFGHLEIEL
jgi:hypothetical protein